MKNWNVVRISVVHILTRMKEGLFSHSQYAYLTK
jgi:hypothetical protein